MKRCQRVRGTGTGEKMKLERWWGGECDSLEWKKEGERKIDKNDKGIVEKGRRLRTKWENEGRGGKEIEERI